MPNVASVLAEPADEEAVSAVDTGMGNVWAARYLSPDGRRRIIGSFGHGSMVNALPQAVGAQFTTAPVKWCRCRVTVDSPC